MHKRWSNHKELCFDSKDYQIAYKEETTTLWRLFTKLLTPSLTCELCNPSDDCCESTNHPADYIFCGLIRELKKLVNKALRIL